MKTCLAILAALALSVGGSSAQIVKIGTVDMKKAFDAYHKTKEAEAKLNAERNASKREMDRREEAFFKISAELKKLDEELAQPDLSGPSREQKMQLRGEKVDELQNAEREVREFQQSRERAMNERSRQLRATIVEDINKVVADKVKSGNYDIVFDKSGASSSGFSIVVNSRSEFDFTEEVVAALNATNLATTDPKR